MAINDVSKFAGGSGASSQTAPFGTGDIAYTSGRRLWLICQGQRDGHLNGQGADWAVTDDATQAITWTKEFTLTDQVQGATFQCETVLYSSSALTSNETFEVSVDQDDTSSTDAFWYGIQIIEAENWDGTFDQIVGTAGADSDTTATATFSPAPSSGDEQRFCSLFENTAGGSTWDTVPTNWAVLSGSEYTGIQPHRFLRSTTNTSAATTDGIASGGGTFFNAHAIAFIPVESATTPEGTATFDADASIATATGARDSQGTATHDADASIAATGSAPGTATVSGTVTQGPDPQQGIVVDRYTDDNGSRGVFIAMTTTDVNGDYSFTVSAPVTEWLTFIAPVGQTWVATGTQFRDVQYTVAVSATEDIDSALTPNVATLTADASIAGTGARASQGQATLSADASIAATGSAPTLTPSGTATFNVDASIASTGARASQGQATLDANATITTAGSAPAQGTATLSAGADISAAGARASQGQATLDAGASIIGLGNSGTPFGVALIEAAASIGATGSAPAQGGATYSATAAMSAVGARASQGVASTYSAVATIYAASITQVVHVPHRVRLLARHGTEALQRHGAELVARHKARSVDR